MENRKRKGMKALVCFHVALRCFKCQNRAWRAPLFGDSLLLSPNFCQFPPQLGPSWKMQLATETQGAFARLRPDESAHRVIAPVPVSPLLGSNVGIAMP